MNKNIKTLIKEHIKNILLERYINLFKKEDIAHYIDDIWDIMERTYEPIGGFKSASSKEELLNDIYLAKLVRKNNKIIAAALYRDKFGRKAIAKGSDGSSEGKNAIKKIYFEDINQKRAWGEFSGKAESIMLKYGGIPIPNDFAEEILNKEIISKDPDGFHYIRLIQGEPHKKIIIGNLQKNLEI